MNTNQGVNNPNNTYSEPGYYANQNTGTTGQNQQQQPGNQGYGKQTMTTARPRTFAEHPALLTTLRILEFASSVLVFSLLAFAIHDYNDHGNHKTNFALAVGVISTFYLLAVFLGTLLMPQFVFAGVLLIAEAIVCLLWLCAFIVIAKTVGEHSCSNSRVNQYNPAYGSISSFQQSGGTYNPYTGEYTTSNYHRACNTSKTAIAFAGFAFVLFVITCILLGLNVLKPIVRNFGGQGLWKDGSYIGSKLQRFTGLALDKPLGNTYNVDMEPGVVGTGVPAADQHTMSTAGESTTNAYDQEKYGNDGARSAVTGSTAEQQPQHHTYQTEATQPTTRTQVQHQVRTEEEYVPAPRTNM
ncbi:uncharacterized protein NDAI_0H03800 [Naumovozyma dairenensis CBS 421]|uniref:MARVEL domain-containing protein n=1 Tax=Naumovozyma dairenensis (strain ATCC 10597 / BCRC 20456 / CBS 421 / NBRC 0211 / NRRL Y-12639) TaxID=1071378 RepID=G0WFJ2_NAUDC|nr:hypothetical protein NDAI_0H03800 [Naumovozyma dairenensis CBS 421]CCD26553.1 hypothetical protein NDAI_0H03800 [Naumovozyma dairenensis CBS 421]